MQVLKLRKFRMVLSKNYKVKLKKLIYICFKIISTIAMKVHFMHEFLNS